MKLPATLIAVVVVVAAVANTTLAVSVWDSEIDSADAGSPFDSLRERLSRDLWIQRLGALDEAKMLMDKRKVQTGGYDGFRLKKMVAAAAATKGGDLTEGFRLKKRDDFDEFRLKKRDDFDEFRLKKRDFEEFRLKKDGGSYNGQKSEEGKPEEDLGDGEILPAKRSGDDDSFRLRKRDNDLDGFRLRKRSQQQQEQRQEDGGSRTIKLKQRNLVNSLEVPNVFRLG